MKGRLSSLSSQSTLGFSPFVDVAINAMAAMFIFLVVYVAAVPPQPRPLQVEFTNTFLPAAIWYTPYRAGLSVSGGVGTYQFQFTTDSGIDLKSLGLQADPDTGIIQGMPEPPEAQDREHSRVIAVNVTVHDSGGQSAEARIDLTINPVAVPFDPDKHRLRFAQPTTTEMPDASLPIAWAGQPYKASVAVLGGIESYQYAIKNLPPGLQFKDGCIFGVPELPDNQSGPRIWDIQITVTDQQSQFLERADHRTIQHRFRLQVNPWRPLELQPLLPLGRADQPYRGVIIANGAKGLYRWTAVEPDILDLLNLELDVDTGVLKSSGLRGDPDQVAQHTIGVRVTATAGTEPVTQEIHAELKILPAMKMTSAPEP